MDTTTRVWWDNEEVKFVGWTEKALVFHWEDPRETAIHMPRGAVLRLMDKGVLRVEGYMPIWLHLGSQPKPVPAAPPPEPSKPPQVNTRLNVIARLIRKLSGDRSPEKASATGS
jgi:hypothetical protein